MSRNKLSLLIKRKYDSMHSINTGTMTPDKSLCLGEIDVSTPINVENSYNLLIRASSVRNYDSFL